MPEARDELFDIFRPHLDDELLGRLTASASADLDLLHENLDEWFARYRRNVMAAPVSTDPKCWCGGRVGPRDPNEAEVYCLDSIFHRWDATGDRDRITKLYVAGPMSGIPDSNYPQFNEVATYLRDAGYEVVNPAEFGEGEHYVDFLREDIRLMLDCHGVAVLDNWWLSVGARNEVGMAGLLKMPVRPYSEWLGRARTELAGQIVQ